MTPPLCLACQVQPVQPAVGLPRTAAPRSPYRIVDGVRWRNYCSRACHLTVIPRSAAALIAYNQQAYQHRVVNQIEVDVRACLANGKVTLSALVKMACAIERRGYQRGMSAKRREKRSAA